MSAPEPTPNASDLPTLQQDVEGNQNQVIGQVLGGIVINQLTIHERIPEPSIPSPVSVANPLTQQEYRQRKVLLNKVKEYWVKGVLETSLHARALIELGLQERPDLVQRSFSGVEEFSQPPGQALPDNSSAATVFDQMGEGRTLLILGEPGSGKTITLLKLAEDLIARTGENLSQPIPVVFNLSSWARKPQPIEKWLMQELLEKYQVSTALGKTWVETESLILLLDGLDEVKVEQRNACVQALNQFMQTHGTTELIICCRIQDYQALAERLMLRSAICIQPLTSDQIDQYFEQAGEQLESLKEVLRQDEELQELATSPLILSVMSLAYQGSKLEDIIQGGTPEEYRQRLFDTYIDRMFQRRGTTQHYLPEQSRHWLVWLAQRMTTSSQTVFLIERLQASWLSNREQRISYGLVSACIGGVSVCLMSGMCIGLIGKFRFSATVGTKLGLISGLVSGLVSGLIVGSQAEINSFETLKWSWQAAKANLASALRYGLLGGTVVFLLFELLFGAEDTWINGMINGTVWGLLAGVISELISGLRGPQIQRSNYPNQGIKRSLQNALIIGISIGLMFGLIGGPMSRLLTGLRDGLIFWPSIVLIGSLIGGGADCIRHFALRLIIYWAGYSPWNYARFLDYAADRLFLQKVGGGYIFVHRMLLEHFAAMPLEQEKR
jgi:DNA polymerase III delta prime subunit